MVTEKSLERQKEEKSLPGRRLTRRNPNEGNFS
jgi:hypothetical protein